MLSWKEVKAIFPFETGAIEVVAFNVVDVDEVEIVVVALVAVVEAPTGPAVVVVPAAIGSGEFPNPLPPIRAIAAPTARPNSTALTANKTA